ncbi:MAG: hypothetical protein CL699_07550 [Chloroflexi bacterium]|nr:hypothetical protein [Chloroflexota bacterium]|tara:strand:- start:23 stop:856 length:834 start_codon:yes stop_codon:yes gene_type:complete
MGRRNVINKSTLSLVAPNYAALSEAIRDFQDEERKFYVNRAAELSEYPGVGNKSKNDVEKAYDNLLGNDPWDYLDEFNRANNDEKNTSDETDNTEDSSGVDVDSFYILLPDKLADRIDNPDATDGYGNNEQKFILYNPGTGYKEVDLLYDNVDFFKTKGSSDSFNDDRFGNSETYFVGFGELPTRYKSNNKMNGRIAHMKRLVGSLWNAQVKPHWDTYQSELNTYNNYTGGGVDTDIYSENVPPEDRPWDGLTNSFKGYNRIKELKGKVIREARGYS